MDAREKIFRYIAENELKDAEFAEAAKIPKSYISKLRSEPDKEFTLTQGRRAARVMKVTLDYLFDPDQDWPPPPVPPDRPTPLTAIEWELLDTARKLCKGDPELTDAFDRLYMRGPYRAVATVPTDLQPPPGKSYGETKNGPRKKPPGPKS